MIHQQQAQQPLATDFKMLELVWSKLTGYPWWPARILQVPNHQSQKYKVQFIGDHTHAFLPANKLIRYDQGKSKYSTPQKLFKGFYAALAQADKLQASLFRESSTGRGDYSKARTIPDQQIQIFNQDVNNSNSGVGQKKIEYNIQSTQKQSIIQKRKMTKAPRPLKINRTIKKVKDHNKKNRIITQLLRKYKLNHIPEIALQQKRSASRFPKKRRYFGFKRHQKPLESSEEQIRAKLVRKIFEVVRGKNIVDLSLARNISVCLANSVISRRKEGVRGAHRALFQWLVNSDHTIIQSSYANWEKSHDKLTTGFTQSNSIVFEKYSQVIQ